MLDFDTKINLEEELSEISPEFQDIFRQTIEQELADTEQNRTDTDILNYLRQRRDDFKRGSFIRPDGRPGMVVLDPETMYEQALPELARSSQGEQDSTTERRRTLIKIGIFVGVVLVFFFFVFRGRAQREDEQAAIEEGTPIAEDLGEGVPLFGTPTSLPPLPEITGVDDSLQTIGNLGGALTIGRPSAIELYFGRTEETIALAIDPSKPTPKGEMRYNETTMLSDNPVAVWLFGTVLNYAIGIPDSMIRNLEPGDRITLNTDTGASLKFVVAETGQGANYEAGRLLSQNRLGLTLFALPSIAEDDVSFALANYDISSEENQGQNAYGIGERFLLNDGASVEITAVKFSHTADGKIRIAVEGSVHEISDDQTMMFSLTSSGEQTTAVQLMPDEEGDWQVNFVMPNSITDVPNSPMLFAEIRALPSHSLPTGSLAIFQLGELSRLTEQLEIEIVEAWWAVEQDQVVISIAIHNPRDGEVYLDSEFIQLLTEGGDANEIVGQIVPRLPILINPGETAGIAVSFLSQDTSVQLQIDADLWEVVALPTTTPTGLQPANDNE